MRTNQNLDYALAAFDLNNYLPIHLPETERMCPFVNSPEYELIVRERYALLSNEAQEMIDIILNPPDEFQRQLEIKNRSTISQGKLTEYLRCIDHKRWTYRIINETFIEIKRFLKEL